MKKKKSSHILHDDTRRIIYNVQWVPSFNSSLLASRGIFNKNITFLMNVYRDSCKIHDFKSLSFVILLIII